ncbi:hypothetical protein SUGI_0219670 [Cryptomeria japonica]|uniref:UNC93-like protein 1 n=1 Tax=Cryptomeria japonica TaxID=3369 RepID=UPI002408A26C|nr:UNC93-like protein 1 [Cryptomeria japonica]GLJ13761.1 hypothetical protein SUGI_0219670 [Cryptomeria japonica]
MGLDNEAQAEEGIPSKAFRYNSPVVQVILIGFVCFCCPGMFNALSGMGGGGQVNPEAANNANTALYTTFAVFGILGGGIYNVLGTRLTLCLGCSTYVLYAGSFLYYNHSQHQLFAIIAGAVLGIGAGLLWAGQGAIMTSYPTEDKKGRYISMFWSIFNLGGVIGGFIPFISNYHRTAGSVNDGTYIGFMCFMGFGALLTLTLLPPHKVVRDDGTKVTMMKYSNPTTEFLEILKLFSNSKMLLLFPAAWASNFFYTYQFNHVNGGDLFTLRTKGLNNVFYWAAQMLGSIGIGYVLDYGSQSRKKRGYMGVAVVALLGTVIWAGGLANELKYNGKKPKLDFKDSGTSYAGPFVLYFSYGLLDAIFQNLVYWMIGALSDDSQTLSRYSGFYKGVQSAGAAVAWQIDAHKTSPVKELVINWCLTTISYPLLLVLVDLYVNDKSSPVADYDGDMKDGNRAVKDKNAQM